VAHKVSVVLVGDLEKLTLVTSNPGFWREHHGVRIKNERSNFLRLVGGGEFDELLHDPARVAIACAKPRIEFGEKRRAQDVLI
jgi:hypothetical protein